MRPTIALIGDHSDSVTAHRAIPMAMDLAARSLHIVANYEWIPTEIVEEANLDAFSGFWCVPASPYRCDAGAMLAIRYAREHATPFLGTCGGYQYAILEYARNALNLAGAENQEVNPDAKMPLISKLSCSLIETGGTIRLDHGSQAREIYGIERVIETYRCSYGINPSYLPLFADSDLRITGWDEAGEPRLFEHACHPFFLGAAFQPERTALTEQSHPLITRFLKSAATFASSRYETL